MMGKQNKLLLSSSLIVAVILGAYVITTDSTKVDLINEDNSTLHSNSLDADKPHFAESQTGSPDDADLGVSEQQTHSCVEKLESFEQSYEFEACANEVMLTSNTALMTSNMTRLLDRWIEFDYIAALDFLVITPNESHHYLLGDAIAKVARIDAHAALNWIEMQHLDRDLRTDFVSTVYIALAEDSPELAIYEAELLVDANLKAHVIDRVIEQWGRQDAVAALKWLDQQPRAEFYSQVKLPVLISMVDHMPVQANDYIQTMPPSAMKSHVSGYYAHKLATTDIEQALDWVGQIQDAESYQAALTPVLEIAATRGDYQLQALELALSEETASIREHLIDAVITQMSSVNLDKAIDLLEQRPDVMTQETEAVIILRLNEKAREANGAEVSVNTPSDSVGI